MSASYIISFRMTSFRHLALTFLFAAPSSNMIQCVSRSYHHATAVEQNAVGVNMDSSPCCCRCSDSTFLEHGDAQVLFTLGLSAAHDGLCLALLRRVVTHCQDLDLTIVLLGSQAIDRC